MIRQDETIQGKTTQHLTRYGEMAIKYSTRQDNTTKREIPKTRQDNASKS